MTITQLTTLPTEADIEARIQASIRAAFSWLPPDGLKHQLKFEFKFGHNVVAINGVSASTAQARLDILVLYQGIPIAVMELKREGLPLSAGDEEQGLSYARMLHPRPPLVVVTNGTETKVLATSSGAEWKPENPSEAEVRKLILNAGVIATGDLARAVETLLGPQSTVWIPAIRAASSAVLADLTGTADEAVPFFEGFLIPRNATGELIDALSSNKRIVILDGPPLAGKSNVLRELVKKTRDSSDFVTFFIEADGAGGSGIFQIIADVMADALGWNVTVDGTRAWLRSLSRRPGPKLVLAIDGISATRDEVRRDAEELTSNAFGTSLRIVLALDDAVTPRVIKNETGRKLTRIGRRAAGVLVGALTDNEFRRAVGVLLDLRIGIMKGGEHTPEYRVPWVLRALVSEVSASSRYVDDSLIAAIPPLLGPQLLHQVRKRFEDDEETRYLFRSLAEAILEDVADRNRPVTTVLESMANYAVRRKTVRKHVEGVDIKSLSDKGLIKLTVNEANEQTVVARLPELVASEISLLLSHRLAQNIERNGPVEAADWLAEQSSRLPFGDVIAAQAIVDCAKRAGSLPLSLIERLLAVPPRKEKIKPGTRAAMSFPGVGKIELIFQSEGKITARIGSYERALSAEEGEEVAQEFYADLEGWLILSHVAGFPFLAESSDGTRMGRVDPAILLEVGTCPLVLRRPPPDPKMSGVLVHDLRDHGSIVCHHSGMVEPITVSMLNFLSNADTDATDWLEEALSRDSLPLTARLDIVFRHLSDGGSKAEWASEILEHRIKPAFARFPKLH